MTYRGALIRATTWSERFLTTPADVRHLDNADSRENCENIALLIDCWLSLLADSPLNKSSRTEKPLRLFRKFRGFLLGRPLDVTVKELSTLAHELVTSTTLTGRSTQTGDFLPAMQDTPVFKEYLEWRKSGDPLLLRYIYTFLSFGKKLDYSDPQLNTTAFRGWLEVEAKLSDLYLDDVDVKDLRRIMHALVGEFSLTRDLYPAFGPGAVSETNVRGKILKANNLRFDAKIDRLLFKSLPGLVSGGDTGYGFQPDAVLPDPLVWNKARGVSTRISTLRFVPKDVTKSRSICMEPNTFMWAQQAVLDQLAAFMREPSGHLSRFITLEDQSRNRRLAMIGSLTSELDTIDLSSASDSVSVELVRKIFPRRLLHALLSTRTSRVKTPDGTFIDVKKFAPMGSALCFPTQCLIFTSVVILSAMRYTERQVVGSREPVRDKWFENFGASLSSLFAEDTGKPEYHYTTGKLQPAAVYGDDIVVDTRITPFVTHLLNSLGFDVNDQKSFTAGQAFRESCGGYYWGGEDVTPLYFRVKRWRRGNPASFVASAVSLANRAGDYGYRNLRRSMLAALSREWKGRPLKDGIQFVSVSDTVNGPNKAGAVGGLCVFSHRPTNRKLRTRFQVNPDPQKPSYQRDEIRVLSLVPYERTDPEPQELQALEKYLMVRWWATRRADFVPSGFLLGGSRGEASGSCLKWRWTPTSD